VHTLLWLRPSFVQERAAIASQAGCNGSQGKQASKDNNHNRVVTLFPHSDAVFCLKSL